MLGGGSSRIELQRVSEEHMPSPHNLSCYEFFGGKEVVWDMKSEVVHPEFTDQAEIWWSFINLPFIPTKLSLSTVLHFCLFSLLGFHFFFLFFFFY